MGVVGDVGPVVEVVARAARTPKPILQRIIKVNHKLVTTNLIKEALSMLTYLPMLGGLVPSIGKKVPELRTAQTRTSVSGSTSVHQESPPITPLPHEPSANLM